MTYVVSEVCIKCKFTDCVEVCPTDAFREGPNMLVIDPNECVDCGLCVPECPVEAIVPDTDLPRAQRALVGLNAELAALWPSIVERGSHRLRTPRRGPGRRASSGCSSAERAQGSTTLSSISGRTSSKP